MTCACGDDNIESNNDMKLFENAMLYHKPWLIVTAMMASKKSWCAAEPRCELWRSTDGTNAHANAWRQQYDNDDQPIVIHGRRPNKTSYLKHYTGAAHPQSDHVCSTVWTWFPSHAMHVHMCTFSVSVAGAGNLALALYGSDWEQQTPSYCKSS